MSRPGPHVRQAAHATAEELWEQSALEPITSQDVDSLRAIIQSEYSALLRMLVKRQSAASVASSLVEALAERTEIEKVSLGVCAARRKLEFVESRGVRLARAGTVLPFSTVGVPAGSGVVLANVLPNARLALFRIDSLNDPEFVQKSAMVLDAEFLLRTWRIRAPSTLVTASK